MEKLIKKALEEKKMTQKELAKKLYVTPQAVSKWLNGESRPSHDNVERIYEILEIDLTKEVVAKHHFNKESMKHSEIKDLDSSEEIGCIHTCQGMEFDYVGVFIGKDRYYKDGHVQTNRNAISKDDKTSGIRLKSTSNEEADKLIRRTYKVLLTRGIKGCYIYCEDEALRNYLKEKLNKN